MSREHRFGRHNEFDAAEKRSPKIGTPAYTNNITRRNVQLTEAMPMRARSTSLLSANIKSLRLFRHICRLMPFVLRVQDMAHQVTPVQSKIYCANHFRENAGMTDLIQIDYLIQYGYSAIYEAEMNYSNSGYLYRFIMPNTHKYRDWGVNRFYDKKAGLINRAEKNTQFLDSFYRGSKSHVD